MPFVFLSLPEGNYLRNVKFNNGFLWKKNLIEKIKEVLKTPDGEINIEQAALLLLSLNRNRILYENILRRKNVEKLKYELQKIYSYHSKEYAAEEVKELEAEAVKVVKTTFPEEEKREATETKGMRPDHDLLPDEIKAKYLENLNLYPRMRKLHEQLKFNEYRPGLRPVSVPERIEGAGRKTA
jgi:hypothetical protein